MYQRGRTARGGGLTLHGQRTKDMGPPINLELILRMHLLQVWFNLSGPGTEDAIYDSYAM